MTKAKEEGRVLPAESRLVLAYSAAIVSPMYVPSLAIKCRVSANGLTSFDSSLFLFAWTAPFPRELNLPLFSFCFRFLTSPNHLADVHWIVPCIAEFLFGLSMLLIFVSFISYLIDVYCKLILTPLSPPSRAHWRSISQ